MTYLAAIEKSNKTTQAARTNQDKNGVTSVVIWFPWEDVNLRNLQHSMFCRSN